MIVKLTDSNFTVEVLEADQPVLVDFWAEWCVPCRTIAPMIKSVAFAYNDKLKVGKLDTEVNEVTAIHYDIRSLPTLMVFKGGVVVAQIVGAVPRSKLEAELRRHF